MTSLTTQVVSFNHLIVEPLVSGLNHNEQNSMQYLANLFLQIPHHSCANFVRIVLNITKQNHACL